MAKQPKILLTGNQLIDLYRDALVARSTSAMATSEASLSERQTIDFLETVSGGTLLNPAAIPEETQADITRASVDAHIKKVQAEQIKAQSDWQMVDLQTQANLYVGKKAKITVLDKAAKPIDAIWYDPKNGSFRTSTTNVTSITGKITEILLDKNALVLQPGTFSKLINPDKQYYVVYVMDPSSMQPFVHIQL